MIIPDAVHVPAYAVQLMAQSKGPDKVIFVSDESPLIGAPVGTKATLWGHTFEIREDEAGHIRSYDLSGSCTSLIECMNIAIEWGRSGVRANCIAPGLIRTDFARALWEDPGILARTVKHSPLNRIGEADEIAGAAVFLASPAAGFMTGQTMVIDGGRLAGYPHVDD